MMDQPGGDDSLEAMLQLALAAPAKINLSLEIIGRRSDGFHELETIFQTIGLHDRVTVGLGPGAGIGLRCSDASLPIDAGNLAMRAAMAMLACRPGCGRISIDLEKRIPSGAGLGGGSSDAAAVLRALQRLLPEPIAMDELLAMAAGLGSDVPFFVMGGTAHGLGRGELLTPLPDLPDRPLTILKPPAPLATPAVYAALGDPERGPRTALGAEAWARRLSEDLEGCLHNRLEAPAIRLVPELGACLKTLRARGIPCLLSGSGSAIFALPPPGASCPLPSGWSAWTTGFRSRADLDCCR